MLAKEKEKISLLEVYEVIEGPMVFKNCLLPTQACTGGTCILGEVLTLGQQMFKKYLSGTNLDMLSINFKEECHVS